MYKKSVRDSTLGAKILKSSILDPNTQNDVRSSFRRIPSGNNIILGMSEGKIVEEEYSDFDSS